MSARVRGQSVTIPKFTNYAPSAGGINGNPNTSATAGIKAKNYTLEDHLSAGVGGMPRTPAVLVATPQWGMFHELFGGIYASSDFAQQLGRQGCIKMALLDHYAKYYKGAPISGRLDINTKQSTSKLTEIINKRQDRTLYLLGRYPGLKKPDRQIARSASARSRPRAWRH